VRERADRYRRGSGNITRADFSDGNSPSVKTTILKPFICDALTVPIEQMAEHSFGFSLDCG
jgi:hypothetical protein